MSIWSTEFTSIQPNSSYEDIRCQKYILVEFNRNKIDSLLEFVYCSGIYTRNILLKRTNNRKALRIFFFEQGTK